MLYFGQFNILKTKITACDYDWIIETIFKNLNNKFVVAPLASHPLTLAYLDKNNQRILDAIDIIVPDSQYVRWALRLLYDVNLKERVYGPELLLKICSMAQKEERKIYFIGNKLGILMRSFKKKFPSLRITGYIDLQYKPISDELIKKIDNEIKTSNPELIFIGIGSPSQHKLAVEMQANRPIICVGAAFDFVSGLKKQAPKWMQKWGLEWFFRLTTEPLILWKRYFIYGTLFLFFIIIFAYKKLLNNFIRRRI